MFQFLRLSTNFLAVLRLSVNPIETLYSYLLVGFLGKEKKTKQNYSKLFKGNPLWFDDNFFKYLAWYYVKQYERKKGK